MHTDTRHTGPTWTVRVYETTGHHARGQPLATLSGIQRKDAAILVATRALLGLDHALPRGEVVSLIGPDRTGRITMIWTWHMLEAPRVARQDEEP